MVNSDANWALAVSSRVHKFLAKIPRQHAEALYIGIGFISVEPYKGDVRKIKGEKDTWRRRIGSYRVFYTIAQKTRSIIVFDIDRRTSNTY
ncbi:MAG TPA: type II toxin-antitoxin system RelE/ParE family toxin [Candidatus Paceibacterota bacterium]